VPGAFEALQELLPQLRFVIVTSRQTMLRAATEEWVSIHFPGLFEGVHFANHYARDGSKPRSKLEIIKELGAVALVDDSRHHALECADGSLPTVVLFGDYAWNKPSTSAAREGVGAKPSAATLKQLAASHENLHRCVDWRSTKQVLQRLRSDGTLSQCPSLWVRGEKEVVNGFVARTRAILLHQDTLSLTAVGIAINSLVAVAAELTSAGDVTVTRTTTGLDAAFRPGAERLPRMTITVKRLPQLLEQEEVRELEAAAVAAASKEEICARIAEELAAPPASRLGGFEADAALSGASA
jgi:hypothetical protein